MVNPMDKDFLAGIAVSIASEVLTRLIITATKKAIAVLRARNDRK